MNSNETTNAAPQQKLLLAVQTGVFLAVLLTVQVMGLPNLLTGTVVNAILIFVSLRLGVRYALILATLSPVGGIVSGHLPAPLYPVFPVIVCGNYLLLVSYWLLRSRNLLMRSTLPALCKAVEIGGAGYMIVQILHLGEKVAWFLFPVLGLQFFTALAGLILGEKIFAAMDQQKMVQLQINGR